MASKPVIHYAVHNGINPKTREPLKLPRIVNQPILSQDDIVDRAIDTYRVKGKRTEVVATMRGIFEQIIRELQDGSAVTIEGLVRFAPTLTGSVGDNCLLTEANELKLNATPLVKMKALNNGDFTFEKVDSKQAE
jgi:hypothetical protein